MESGSALCKIYGRTDHSGCHIKQLGFETAALIVPRARPQNMTENVCSVNGTGCQGMVA